MVLAFYFRNSFVYFTLHLKDLTELSATVFLSNASFNFDLVLLFLKESFLVKFKATGYFNVPEDDMNKQ